MNARSTTYPGGITFNEARPLVLPSVMVLCGLPGAGKSTLARFIESACVCMKDVHGQPMVVRVNKDDMRGKGQVDATALQVLDRGGVVVVDNCNGSAELRRVWASRARGPSAHRGASTGLRADGRAVCVFLDTELEECKYRATHRSGHPSLSGPGAASIVDREAEKFSPPTIDEGFADVVNLRNPVSVNEFLQSLSLPPLVLGEDLVLAPDRGVVKYPRTCHLVDCGAATRDDKILESNCVSTLIGSGLVLDIEEKLDGANMGISITSEGEIRVQNRSHVVDCHYHEQFKPLDKWVARHSSDLWQVLEPGRHILYGEWLHATHSVEYTCLPDWFLAFDLYDRHTDTFLGREELAARLADTGLHLVPLVGRRAVNSLQEALAMVHGPSAFADGPREGVVLRLCDRGLVRTKAKLVRGDFTAGIQAGRWNRGPLRTNRLALG